MSRPFKICGEKFSLGMRKIVYVEIGHLYDFTEINIPVEVIRGTKDGPVLFLSGAIHGDEINGTEIIRRIVNEIDIEKLHGTILAVPVVNVFGFNTRSRYLPDRRDLNRSFPGSLKGSLASQMAKIFMREIVLKSTHGIDFHTGSLHRYNIPQVRTSIDDKQSRAMARAFGAEVILSSNLRDGSLREAAGNRRIPIILYEGGEALRFEEQIIASGVVGALRVMEHLKMLPKSARRKKTVKTMIAKDSYWVRAPHGGSLRVLKAAGEKVVRGECIALVQDLFGKTKIEVLAQHPGIIIGMNQLPLINKGDALFHIATGELLDHLRLKDRLLTLYELNENFPG